LTGTLHDGRWKHRDEERLATEFGYKIQSARILARKRRFPGRGWKSEIKESGQLKD
jgi:hypothetical protein